MNLGTVVFRKKGQEQDLTPILIEVATEWASDVKNRGLSAIEVATSLQCIIQVRLGSAVQRDEECAEVGRWDPSSAVVSFSEMRNGKLHARWVLTMNVIGHWVVGRDSVVMARS